MVENIYIYKANGDLGLLFLMLISLSGETTLTELNKMRLLRALFRCSSEPRFLLTLNFLVALEDEDLS